MQTDKSSAASHAPHRSALLANGMKILDLVGPFLLVLLALYFLYVVVNVVF